MKLLVIPLFVLFAWGYALAQETEQVEPSKIRDILKYKNEPTPLDSDSNELSLKKLVKFSNPDWKPVPKQTFPQNHNDDKFGWKPALWQSGLFLALQHSVRLIAEKPTRDELKGPFFRDWKDSLKNLRGWDDGGKFFTNYIAHPLQGAITARIFINNSPKSKKLEFGRSSDYWKSRLRALAWAAVWSTQFEIGPISEATLGNVGRTLHADGRSKLTYSDLVLTPVLGAGIVVLEDIVDKYVLKNWLEKKGIHRFIIRMLRTVLTPAMTFANPMRFRTPWTREFRRY